MSTGDIIVEAIWSSPSIEAFFLEPCRIYIQIRNIIDNPIEIQKIECYFQSEEDGEPHIPNIAQYLTIEPGHLSDPIRLEFKVDITWKANTNSYRIVIHYFNATLKVLNFVPQPQKYFIFKPQGPNDKIFFISHKDDEDTKNGRSLANFLHKLGFIGYLSEDDHRPGIDLWKEKIPKTIASSVAMIILWTNKAASNPDNIYREISIAKSESKRLIMAIENGVSVPSDFPKHIEYFPVQHPISASDLKRLACSIEDTYRRGGYSK